MRSESGSPNWDGDEKFAVWNTLHDGTIESIRGSIPGDIAVEVGIAYLCKMLPTKSSRLVVQLRGCDRLEYEPYEGTLMTSPVDLAEADIEVLSAQFAHGVVSVECSDGTLRLVYSGASVELIEGVGVSRTELQTAAGQYWEEWKARWGLP